jgi:hypothetical protein
VNVLLDVLVQFLILKNCNFLFLVDTPATNSADMADRDAHCPTNGSSRQFEKSRRLRPVNRTAVKLISSRVGWYGMSKEKGDTCKCFDALSSPNFCNYFPGEAAYRILIQATFFERFIGSEPEFRCCEQFV